MLQILLKLLVIGVDDTRECHARFGFLKRLYKYRLDAKFGIIVMMNMYHIIEYVR